MLNSLLPPCQHRVVRALWAGQHLFCNLTTPRLSTVKMTDYWFTYFDCILHTHTWADKDCCGAQGERTHSFIEIWRHGKGGSHVTVAFLQHCFSLGQVFWGPTIHGFHYCCSKIVEAQDYTDDATENVAYWLDFAYSRSSLRFQGFKVEKGVWVCASLPGSFVSLTGKVVARHETSNSNVSNVTNVVNQ